MFNQQLKLFNYIIKEYKICLQKDKKVYNTKEHNIIEIKEDDLYVGEMFIDITNNIIPNIYDYYKISNFGRVYNKFTGVFLKPGISGSGYHFVYLYGNQYKKMCQVHRLVMMAFYPIQNPENFEVNHKNGNKLDNTVLNLEWCTRSENAKHAYSIGLNKNTNQLINHEIAKQVCELILLGYSNNKIVETIGPPLTTGIAQDIRAGSSWTNISSSYDFNRRIGRLFDEEMVINICVYFSTNNIGNLTINDFCRNALSYYDYPTSDNIVDSARKIYTRKYYCNISQKFIF